ncbi:hypothetical protein M501DRAFT_263799 [Patellaria atrata CBS 101060]|uniref:TAFII55 protein conserved region domain-containing protein n=1 Tax=Patellaria atrata CBS 101060 TaxID=1346257 RepID=A0A9P4S5X4_9PEZI|nr:hypothetical protein M501DRAFT_263799 [Patellaria atrata CBS 101060]
MSTPNQSSDPPPNLPKMNPPMLKLKIKTNAGVAGASASEPQLANAVQTPGGGIRLKLKTTATPTVEQAQPILEGATPAKKEKRKYTKKADKLKQIESGEAPPPKEKKQSKKRAREDADGSISAKRQAITVESPTSLNVGEEITVAPDSTLPPRNRSVVLKVRNPKEKIPKIIKIKRTGAPPVRPLGVGYDSEAEDVEDDPAIESAFILRMEPGDDCDYIRQAIADKKIGIPAREGGADISMRFYDREGRRVAIHVRGNVYAACLVDLPCVIEGMKSWDRRGWWKTTDICQMLLVIGRVNQESDVMTKELPREIDRETYQYPHGLTPPMRFVRKRRFRKRVSFRTIEAVENEVERLLELDENAAQSNGTTTFTIIDKHRENEESVHEEDAEGEYDDGDFSMADAEGEVDDEGEVDLEAFMEDALAEGDDENIASAETVTLSVETPNPETNFHTLPSTTGSFILEEATPSPAQAGTTSEDDDEDEDEDQDEEVDEETLEKQAHEAAAREEIEELEREISQMEVQLKAQTNPLLKERISQKMQTAKANLELKKRTAGLLEWDE